MPVPGPRTQQGPDPGYTNPHGQVPTRTNLWGRPAPVAQMGRSPGLMGVTLRGCVLGAGQIRRMWRQSVNYIAAPAAYSWTASAPDARHPAVDYPAVGLTRALRYMTRSVYMGSGFDNTRYEGLHTSIRMRVRSKPVTVGKGQARSRPTVRNRNTSFGSRVPTINHPTVGAEPQ